MHANRSRVSSAAALAAALLLACPAGNCGAGNVPGYPGVATGDKLLAVGPLPVTVTVANRKGSTAGTTKEIQATLLLLTEQTILYQVKDGKVQKGLAAANPPQVLRIRAPQTEKEQAWAWDLDKTARRFTGEVRPTERLVIPRGVTYNDKQKNQFLFFTYVRMVNELEEATRLGAVEKQQALLRKADRIEDLIIRQGLDTDVATLFKNLAARHRYLLDIKQQHTDLLLRLAKTDARLERLQTTLAAESACLANTQMTALGLNFLSMLFGGEGTLAPDPYILRRGLMNFQERLWTDLARLGLSDAQQQQVLLVQKQWIETILKRKADDKQIAKNLGLPFVDWYGEMTEGVHAAKKDWPNVAQRLTEMHDEVLKATPHGDPWLALEILRIRSSVSVTKYDNEKLLREKILANAASRYAVAQQMVELLNKLPYDDALKGFHAEVLACAATHAVEAGERELDGKVSLGTVYSLKAVYALRLLEVADRYKLEDVAREVSETRVRALALAQLHQEALDLGGQFVEARPTASFHLTMARLHLLYANDYRFFSSSREHLKRAIKAGLYDFSSLQTNADLSRLVTPDFVYENMVADVSIRMDTDKDGTIKAFVLTNNSPFPVINGTFSVGKVIGMNRLTKFITVPVIANTNFRRIEYLGPKASLTIPDSQNINNAPFLLKTPLFGFLITNQGVPGFPVKVSLER